MPSHNLIKVFGIFLICLLFGVVIALWTNILVAEPAGRVSQDYYETMGQAQYIRPLEANLIESSVATGVVTENAVIPINISLQDTQAVWYRALQVASGVYGELNLQSKSVPEIQISWRDSELVVHTDVAENNDLRDLQSSTLLNVVHQMNIELDKPMETIWLPHQLLEPGQEEGTYFSFPADETLKQVNLGEQNEVDGFYLYLVYPGSMNNETRNLFIGRRLAESWDETAPEKDVWQLVEQLLNAGGSDHENPGWPIPPQTQLTDVGICPDDTSIKLEFNTSWWEHSGPWAKAALDSLRLTLGQLSNHSTVQLSVAETDSPPQKSNSDSIEVSLLREVGSEPDGEFNEEVLLNYISREIIMSQYIEDAEMLMSAVGDVMLDRGLRSKIDEHGNDWPFSRVADTFRQDDLTFINLESPLAYSGEPLPGKQIWFRGDPQNAAAIRRAGVDVINLANNHILDFGRPAMVETMKHLREKGYLPLGVGMNKRLAHEPLFWESHGKRLAFLAYTDFADIFWDWDHRETFAAGVDLPGVAALEPDLMERDVRRAKQRADAVVVSVHWGEEYVPHPSEEHAHLARRLVDAGTSAIIGHHPHVLQSIETYQDRPVLYSLGNFIFDQEPIERRQTAVAQLEWGPVAEEGLAVQQVRLYPHLIQQGQPVPAKGSDAEQVMDRLQQLASERGTELLRRDDLLILPLSGDE